MASRRLLLSLFGPSIFRNNTINISPIRFTKLFPFPTLRCNFYSAAAIVNTITTPSTETAVNPRHPWPEWVTFVDHLKTKGYLLQTPSLAVDEGADSTNSDGIFYKDMNILKDACLSFARDRFDIFKSLSRQDIQTVAEKGCPSLFRKAVNSGKRLRIYVRLDEGEVCSGCNLRGSCDRAYVILNESEAVARTVDIVRILLFYALDPLVISGGEKPAGRELIEVSARKLLSELIELTDKSPDPELLKPALKATLQKKDSWDIELKRGDWICPKCDFMNFSRNMQCRKCGEDGPKRDGGDVIEMKKGDWICLECNFMNFSRNVRCLKCKLEGPKRVNVDEVEMKKGDWNCPQCGFMNFASNTKCLSCREQRPKRHLNPGEWECPSCDFLNFRSNLVCRKCNCEHPKVLETQYGDQLWRKPF